MMTMTAVSSSKPEMSERVRQIIREDRRLTIDDVMVIVESASHTMGTESWLSAH
jgi:hypothetical protein